MESVNFHQLSRGLPSGTGRMSFGFLSLTLFASSEPLKIAPTVDWPSVNRPELGCFNSLNGRTDRKNPPTGAKYEKTAFSEMKQ